MGFSVTLTDQVKEIGGRIYVEALASLFNGELEYTATGIAREEETKKGMDGAQVTGAASSYARKYALNGLFAIDDTKDSDATNNHGKSQESALQAKAKTGMPPLSDFDIQFQGLIETVNKITQISELKELWDELLDEAKQNKEVQQLFNHKKQDLTSK